MPSTIPGAGDIIMNNADKPQSSKNLILVENKYVNQKINKIFPDFWGSGKGPVRIFELTEEG